VATFFFFKFMRLAQSWSRSLAASMTIAFFYHTIKLASCKSPSCMQLICHTVPQPYSLNPKKYSVQLVTGQSKGHNQLCSRQGHGEKMLQS